MSPRCSHWFRLLQNSLPFSLVVLASSITASPLSAKTLDLLSTSQLNNSTFPLSSIAGNVPTKQVEVVDKAVLSQNSLTAEGLIQNLKSVSAAAHSAIPNQLTADSLSTSTLNIAQVPNPNPPTSPAVPTPRPQDFFSTLSLANS